MSFVEYALGQLSTMPVYIPAMQSSIFLILNMFQNVENCIL